MGAGWYRVNGVERRMRETPRRRARLPPAGCYHPYANGSLWPPPLSFVNNASSSSATIHRRENRLWCSALSLVPMAAGPDDRSPPPYRHNIPRSACRLRTVSAADRFRWLCGRRSAGQPASHRFASASGRWRRDGFYTTRARCTPADEAAAGSQFVCRCYDPRSKIRFASTPISPSIVSFVSVLYGRNESVQKNVSTNVVGDDTQRIVVFGIAANNNAQSWRSSHHVIKTS